MDNVNASTVIHADQHAEVKAPNKSQGTLQAEGKEHTFFPFADTESVSQGVSEFLGDINEPDLPETLLSTHTFTEITQELIETEEGIQQLFEELEQPEKLSKDTPLTSDKTKRAIQSQKNVGAKPQQQGSQSTQSNQAEQPEAVYSSLFSLAHSFNKGLSEVRQQKRAEQQPPKKSLTHEKIRPNQSTPLSTPETLIRDSQMTENLRDEQDKEQDEEQKKDFGGQQDQQQQQRQKKKRNIFNVKASRLDSRKQAPYSSANQSLGSVENIYVRFMALMARILGQAEAEAHDLYMRIKERTDNVDLLTLLLSKINSEKGSIDWSNNKEMQQLIEKARALGVEIPQGKLKWSEDEKKLFKENIQMRKDSMEKVTQLERTDMQRYLQEASQCHQARSNVLKLLKEVMDTIIHNMRP